MNSVLKTLGIITLAIVLIAVGVALGMVAGDKLEVGTAEQPVLPRLRGMMEGYYGDDSPRWNEGMPGRRGNRDGGDRQEWQGGRGGMMGGYVPDADLAPAKGETLTLEQAVKVAEAYLSDYDDDNLEVAELMQFDNHFYAAIREKDTGTGAFEILIDPETAAVYQEPGPNMMWNTEYGMMQTRRDGAGRRGMMQGYLDNSAPGEMTVSADEARELAQAALDDEIPGVTLADEAEQFYGYYTIDTLKDGEPAGMLSVNGYTGRVWLHSWHGAFVDMVEEED